MVIFIDRLLLAICIDRLLTLGKIPKNSEMTDEQFKKYDCLLAMFEEALSFEEAEQMMPLFSDDCDDLNWFLLHAIESVPHAEVQNYKKLIAKCPNEEFREILEIRLNKQ